ncbi:MAG: hypothetical protein M3198_10620 [Actinomycetota bacterium]|nr:hypothetical protein [Actinomycetota bacterium]
MSIPEDGVRTPPFALQLDISEAAIELHRAALREATYLGSAKKPADELTGRDLETLVGISVRLEEELASAKKQADFLRRIFDDYPDWVNDRVRAALESEHLNAADSEKVRQVLKVEDNDFAGHGKTLCESFIHQVSTERLELRDQAFALRDQGVLDPETAHSTGCKLLGLAILGGLATCFPTEGAGCVVALGATIAYVGFGC